MFRNYTGIQVDNNINQHNQNLTYPNNTQFFSIQGLIYMILNDPIIHLGIIYKKSHQIVFNQIYFEQFWSSYEKERQQCNDPDAQLDFCLYNQVMIKKGLVVSITRSLFNFNKKNVPDVTPKPDKPRNKRYLVEKILQANKNKPKLLPPKKDPSKLTVVLEMDEVLAYTFTPDEEGYLMAPRRKEDFHLWFQQYEVLLNIYKRKNLDNFLSYLHEQCQPVIFSTGVKSYVQLVMGLIDPTKKIKHILTQQHCDRILQQQSDIDQYVKDLSLLGRDLDKVIYIDCKPMSFWLYPDNGMCSQQFKADNSMKYEDLDELLLEIEECRKSKDVRDFIRQEYNLMEDFKDSGLL